MARDPLLAIAVIIALGAVSKLLAERYGVPNVVFLLGFGILLGPDGLGFLDVAALSDGLSVIVGVAVAIIVFEGAFSLSLDELTASSRSTYALVTLGSAITFVGLGFAIAALVRLPWALSFLISALLVATGPTVIAPVLEQIRVRERVRTLLETEGIVNDPVASVLGAVIFSATLSTTRIGGNLRATEWDIVADFVTQIGVGVLVGIVTAALVGVVLRSFSKSPQHSRIVVLAGALLSYAVATTFATEAGVVSVAVAGLLLGNVAVPYKQQIAGFSGDVSTIILGVVYIVLAALIRFDEILALGLAGFAVVLIAMVVVRPLAVFCSTYRSKFTRKERLFVSAIGPRGIIPAATATLFTLRLRAEGIANATSVVSLVFLVILVTVVTEAGGARFIADRLDITPMHTLIVGGGEIGRTLADHIEARGDNPVIVERDEATVAALRAQDYSVVHGNGTSARVLERANVADAEMVVATTNDDGVNILACQTARTVFGTETLVSLVSDPAKVAAFEDLGVLTVTPPTATVTAIGEIVTLPSLFAWREQVGHAQKLAEETVVSDEIDGKSVGEIDLPRQCVVVLIQRGARYIVPTHEVVLRKGDHVTILGRSDAVEAAVSMLTE